MFIAHPETRKLLLRYSLKGIQNDMHSHLLELTDKHGKCIAPLLKHLTSTRNDTDIVTSWYPCMAEGTYTDRMNGVHAWLRAPILGALSHAWTPFILSLAATSPVCALVHCADQHIWGSSTLCTRTLVIDLCLVCILRQTKMVVCEDSLRGRSSTSYVYAPEWNISVCRVVLLSYIGQMKQKIHNNTGYYMYLYIIAHLPIRK